jgi:hypothetical protein
MAVLGSNITLLSVRTSRKAARKVSEPSTVALLDSRKAWRLTGDLGQKPHSSRRAEGPGNIGSGGNCASSNYCFNQPSREGVRIGLLYERTRQSGCFEHCKEDGREIEVPATQRARSFRPRQESGFPES